MLMVVFCKMPWLQRDSAESGVRHDAVARMGCLRLTKPSIVVSLKIREHNHCPLTLNRVCSVCVCV